YVVGRRVGFNAGNFAKIIDRVGGVRRASAYPQDEQSAAILSDTGEKRRHSFDRRGVEFTRNLLHLGEKVLGETHCFLGVISGAGALVSTVYQIEFADQRLFNARGYPVQVLGPVFHFSRPIILSMDRLGAP